MAESGGGNLMIQGIYVAKDATKDRGQKSPNVHAFLWETGDGVPVMENGRWRHGIAAKIPAYIGPVCGPLVGLGQRGLEALAGRPLADGELIWRPIGLTQSKGIFKRQTKASA